MDFSDELSCMDTPEKIRLTAFVISEGLMRAPFPIGMLFGLVRWRHGKIGVKNVILKYAKDHEASVLEMFEQTLHHMVYGKDREDSDSVGGFSQREINMILKEARL